MTTIYVCTDLAQAVVAFLVQAYARKVPIALYVANPEHWDDLLWHRAQFLPHQIGHLSDYNHIAIFALDSPHQPDMRCVRVHETSESDLAPAITHFVTTMPPTPPHTARIYRQEGVVWTVVQ